MIRKISEWDRLISKMEERLRVASPRKVEELQEMLAFSRNARHQLYLHTFDGVLERFMRLFPSPVALLDDSPEDIGSGPAPNAAGRYLRDLVKWGWNFAGALVLLAIVRGPR